MQIERVAVIGAGLMGTNIALDFARAGFPVTITDSGPEPLAESARTLRANLAELAAHGLLREAPETVAARVEPCRSLPDTVCDADLVIEAVTEDLELKEELFGRLDFYTPEGAILASNTSSFMPTSLARRTARAARVAVTHYFNPAHLVPLVELVGGEETHPDTIETLRSLYAGMGKHPVVVRKETLGFIGNRLQFALLREALALVERGVATPEDVDTVIRSGFGRRLPATGVFHTFDLAGLDTVLAVGRVLFPDLCTADRPGPALTEPVARGRLGAKSGAGWFDYPGEEAAAARRRLSEELLSRARQDAGG